MNDRNTSNSDSANRDDLTHTDTVVVTGSPATADPAGYEQSLNPAGEVPPAGERAELPADEGPISARVGRDPSNLGDDIPDQGDVVHPSPINAPVGKAPGM